MDTSSLHVAQISFFADPERRSPAQLLDAWPTLGNVANAIHGAGARVSLVQACAQTESLQRGGVGYHFLPFGKGLRDVRGSLTLGEALGSLAPDVLHVQGLDFPNEVLSLVRMAPGIPIVLQDHASRPPRIWRRALWRRAMEVASGIAFCALDQARPFAKAGLIGKETRVFEIPESTSGFTPGQQDEARRITGVQGDPAVLWVGHLDANKDPLTVLAAISDAARTLPRIRLHCCFGTAPLLQAVQDRIANDPRLRGRVRLLGRVPHEQVELLMRAADIFILGSQREGSGYSLIEALACGVAPVVTDIPSFRALTGAGRVGKLWACRDSYAAAEGVRLIAARLGPDMRAAVRAHFERELSSAALGRKMVAMYAEVMKQRRATSLPAQRSAQQNAIRTS